MASKCESGYDPRKIYLGDFYTLEEVLARFDATSGCTCRIRGLLYQFDGERWVAVAEGIENGGEVFAARFLGMFETLSDLKEKYPAPLMGALSVILATNSWWVYREGEWKDMGIDADLELLVSNMGESLSNTMRRLVICEDTIKQLSDYDNQLRRNVDTLRHRVDILTDSQNEADANIKANTAAIATHTTDLADVKEKAEEAQRVAANAIGRAASNASAAHNAHNEAVKAANMANIAYDAVANLEGAVNTLLKSNISENIDTYNEVLNFLKGFIDSDNLKDIMDAISTAAGKNLESVNRIDASLDKVNARLGSLTIIPVNGLADMSMFEGADALFSGVWIVGNSIQFVSSDEGFTDDDYNVGAGTSRHPREDRIFQCGGQLYSYRDGKLSPFATDYEVRKLVDALEGRMIEYTDHLEGEMGNQIVALDKRVREVKGEQQNLSNDMLFKVDSIPGKGLSTNDFTDELKARVENMGEPYVHPAFHSASMIIETPDKRFINENQAKTMILGYQFNGILPGTMLASEAMESVEGIWWCDSKRNDLAGFSVGIWVGNGTSKSDGIFNSSSGAIGTTKLMYTADGDVYLFIGRKLIEVSSAYDSNTLRKTVENLANTNTTQDTAIKRIDTATSTNSTAIEEIKTAIAEVREEVNGTNGLLTDVDTSYNSMLTAQSQMAESVNTLDVTVNLLKAERDASVEEATLSGSVGDARLYVCAQRMAGTNAALSLTDFLTWVRTNIPTPAKAFPYGTRLSIKTSTGWMEYIYGGVTADSVCVASNWSHHYHMTLADKLAMITGCAVFNINGYLAELEPFESLTSALTALGNRLGSDEREALSQDCGFPAPGQKIQFLASKEPMRVDTYTFNGLNEANTWDELLVSTKWVKD